VHGGGGEDHGAKLEQQRAHQRAPLVDDDLRERRERRRIARDLEKPQSVKYFAAQLRLSASRFEHLFKDQTGLAFKAFLLAARMTRAKNMLKDRTLRIKEVAAAVGYANVSNFIRDYTKRYGESPSQSRSSSLRDSLIPFSSRRGVPGGGPR